MERYHIFRLGLAVLFYAAYCVRPSIVNAQKSEDNQTKLDGTDLFFYQGGHGRPGVDFPVLSHIPRTSFNCRDVDSGYYADLETDCQVFHICEENKKISFLCPNGTIFQQSELICEWWFKVNCTSSPNLYEESAEQLREESARRKSSRRVSNHGAVMRMEQRSSVSVHKNGGTYREVDNNDLSRSSSSDFVRSGDEKGQKGRKPVQFQKQPSVDNGGESKRRKTVKNSGRSRYQEPTTERPQYSVSRTVVSTTERAQTNYVNNHRSNYDQDTYTQRSRYSTNQNQNRNSNQVIRTDYGATVSTTQKAQVNYNQDNNYVNNHNSFYDQNTTTLRNQYSSNQSQNRNSDKVSGTNYGGAVSTTEKVQNNYNHKSSYHQDTTTQKSQYSANQNQKKNSDQVSRTDYKFTISTTEKAEVNYNQDSNNVNNHKSYYDQDTTTQKSQYSANQNQNKNSDQVSGTDYEFTVSTTEKPQVNYNQGSNYVNNHKSYYDQDTTTQKSQYSTNKNQNKNSDQVSRTDSGFTVSTTEKAQVNYNQDNNYVNNHKSFYDQDTTTLRNQYSSNQSQNRNSDKVSGTNYGTAVSTTEKVPNNYNQGNNNVNNHKSYYQQDTTIQKSQYSANQNQNKDSDYGFTVSTTEKPQVNYNQDSNNVNNHKSYYDQDTTTQRSQYSTNQNENRNSDHVSRTSEGAAVSTTEKAQINYNQPNNYVSNSKNYYDQDISTKRSISLTSSYDHNQNPTTLNQINYNQYSNSVNKQDSTDQKSTTQRSISSTSTYDHYQNPSTQINYSDQTSNTQHQNRSNNIRLGSSFKFSEDFGTSTFSTPQPLPFTNDSDEFQIPQETASFYKNSYNKIDRDRKVTNPYPNHRQTYSELKEPKYYSTKSSTVISSVTPQYLTTQPFNNGRPFVGSQVGTTFRSTTVAPTPHGFGFSTDNPGRVVPSDLFNIGKTDKTLPPTTTISTPPAASITIPPPGSFNLGTTERVLDHATVYGKFVTSTTTTQRPTTTTTPTRRTILLSKSLFGGTTPTPIKVSAKSSEILTASDSFNRGANQVRFFGKVETSTKAPRGYVRFNSISPIPLSLNTFKATVTSTTPSPSPTPGFYVTKNTTFPTTVRPRPFQLSLEPNFSSSTKPVYTSPTVPSYQISSASPFADPSTPAPTQPTPFTTARPTLPATFENVDSMITALAEMASNYSDLRPGLVVPPSVGPQTLHTLAVYFANALDGIAEEKEEPVGEEVTEEIKVDTEKNKLTELLTQMTMDRYNELFSEEEVTVRNRNTDDDLEAQNSKGPAQAEPKVRQLAKVFTQALSSYLDDPATFRKVLQEVRPTEPPTTDTDDIIEEELLNFSDADSKSSYPPFYPTPPGVRPTWGYLLAVNSTQDVKNSIGGDSENLQGADSQSFISQFNKLNNANKNEVTTKSSVQLPNDHWTSSPDVNNLWKKAFSFDPASINENFGTTEPTILTTETELPEPIKDQEHRDIHYELKALPALNLNSTQVHGILIDFMNTTKNDDTSRLQRILRKLNTTEDEFLAKMKEIESNPLTRRLILLLINECGNSTHAVPVHTLLPPKREFLETASSNAGFRSDQKNSPLEIVDPKLGDSQDARALQLLNSLYTIASRFGK